MTEVSKFSSSKAHTHLNALRAGAAVTVFISHWRSLIFTDFSTVHGGMRILLAPLFLVAACGHASVVIFFVLSGYLVSGSLIRSAQRGQVSIASYSVHRLTRLWTVLIPALGLTALLDTIGYHTRAEPWYTGHVETFSVVGDALQHIGLKSFLANAAFLETLHASLFGSNVVLWSLAYEFWYYVMFPLLFFLVLWRLQPGRRIASAACFVALLLVCWFVGVDCSTMFPMWLIGVVLHYTPSASDIRARRIWGAVVFAPLFLLAGALSHRTTEKTFLDGGLALATTCFMWLLLGAKHHCPDGLYKRLSDRLAAGSYTLYLVHFPVLLLCTGLLIGAHRVSFTFRSTLLGLGIFWIASLVAWSMYRLFESRTEQVRDYVWSVLEAKRRTV